MPRATGEGPGSTKSATVTRWAMAHQQCWPASSWVESHTPAALVMVAWSRGDRVRRSVRHTKSLAHACFAHMSGCPVPLAE